MITLTALGTGFAVATNCYTTSFAINFDNEYFLLDTGGGSGILTNLQKTNIPLSSIHHIFLSHKHTDHIIGTIWLVRMLSHALQKGTYKGNLHLYCQNEIADKVLDFAYFCLGEKAIPLLKQAIIVHPLTADESFNILNHEVTFFDTFSNKTKQYGCKINLTNQQNLVFLGDEPYNEQNKNYAQNATYLMHEAMCLQSDSQKYNPHKISHSTVKDAAINAQNLNAQNLIMHHTEDFSLSTRKISYTNEAKAYFNGTIYMPDDLDVIQLI